MNNIKKIISAIAFFLLSLASILTIVDLCCFDRGFYEQEYAKDNTAMRIGMSDEDLMKSTNALLDYLQDERQDIVVDAEVNGDMREVFDERETAHMVDVKDLYQGAILVRNITAIAGSLLLCAMLILTKEDRLSFVKDGFVYGIGLTITLIAAIAIYAMVDFTAFWINFHELFFDNDLWLLNPNTSIMINMFPEVFFSDLVIRIILFTAGLHLIVWLLLFRPWRKA